MVIYTIYGLALVSEHINAVFKEEIPTHTGVAGIVIWTGTAILMRSLVTNGEEATILNLYSVTAWLIRDVGEISTVAIWVVLSIVRVTPAVIPSMTAFSLVCV